MNRILEEDFERLADPFTIDLLKAKNIIITGATGFIGGYLYAFCKWLNKKGCGIKVFTWPRNSKLDLGANRIDLIFHCASSATPERNTASYEDVLYTNVTMTRELLSIASKHYARLLFISAGEVYGSTKATRITEKQYGGFSPLTPRSCYPITKCMGENMCSFASNEAQVYIARLFHTYGPGIKRDDPRIFSVLAHSISNNNPIHLASKGNAIRAFCYISDVIAGFFTILRKGVSGGAYNVGSEDAVSIKRLARKLARVYNTEVQFGEMQDTSRLVPDCSKLKRLGWEPQIKLLDGFQRTITFIKEER
jgi:UDP-glucuronate decarboxylase